MNGLKKGKSHDWGNWWDPLIKKFKEENIYEAGGDMVEAILVCKGKNMGNYSE